MISLREYLVDNEAPAFKSKRQQADCSSVCPAVHLNDQLNKQCKSGKWAPNYAKVGECECLIEYKCCEDACPAVNKNSCWGTNSSQMGLKFGDYEVDCCGCQAVRCFDCEPVQTKAQVCPTGKGARPLDCYTYTPHNSYTNDDDKCFVPHCEENASDAPANAECNQQ